ncbi:Vacuolar protein sorting-associated protein 53 [Rhizophlyctis rosea]|uniref:Vacuolar protein sorting-associated protein 53 n=1 Tax=Rhizophlyctis rosea TaxID=64517 RepID=A0AAD5SJM8_9FUNG|nr:Vacuolar protein sorting-associated protein 53 [Rhizophlyctis rosea]
MDASSTKDAKSPSQDAVDELEGDGRHETISLEPDLDLAISSVLATKDPLDSSDFDPIEYINLIFPNEQSLATIDNVLTKLRTKIRRMDIEMRELVRSQTDAGQQTASDLRDAQKAITELYSNYERIREKAVQSEKMVQEITKDIKSLDQAKNNLTVSVIVLRRLHMLVSALDQLRGAVSRRQYTDAASLLQVVNQLLVHFKGFRSVDQIAVLLEDAAKLQVDLKRAIFGEFEGAFVGGTLRSQYQTLHEACRVVDVIGAETRQELVNWYCELQLKDYRNIFRINQEVAGLADVSRRYAWFKRLLKTYDDDHCAAFPNDWRVAEAASEKFCQDTRKDLSEQLAKADHNMDVKVLLQAIQTTVDFEGKLHKRFDPRDLEAEKLTEVEVNQAPPGSKFHKIISSCFDPYLRHYIDSQDKVLSDLLETYRSRPTATEEESVLASSTDLFYSYRQTLGAFAKLSTKKPFLDLCILFGKWLRNYADMLLSKLPSDEKKAIGNEDIRSICLIINTADYCAATTTQLEEKLVEKIDEEFRPSVNFNLERDGFVNVSGSGIRALVRGIENSIEPAFNTMLKKPWGTVEAVGDQSDYVNTIATTLQFSVGAVKQHFASNKYFRTFCDKFSESFLGRYYNNIFKCKPISEVGAEQMLLDTHALKTILLQMANIGAEPGTQPPSTYLKLLNKGVTKVEQLLKVVLRPYEPVEGIVETYLLLFNDYSIANFQKVLELKGLKRAEQQAVMEAFQRRIPPDGNKSVGDLAGAGASTNATAAALAAAGAKFNMRKFVAGMNIPASMKLG